MERILDRLVNENLLLFGTGTDTQLASINILSQVTFKRKRGICSSSLSTFKRFMRIKGMSFGKKLYVASLNTLKAIIVGSHSLARLMRQSARKSKNGFQMFLCRDCYKQCNSSYFQIIQILFCTCIVTSYVNYSG